MSKAKDALDLAPQVARGGRKNLLINGSFDVWQRGVDFSSQSGDRYVADRWMVHSSGSTDYRCLRGDKHTDGLTYHHLYLQDATSDGETDFGIKQRLPGCDYLSGQSITMSCKFQPDTDGTFKFALSIAYEDGSFDTLPVSATRNFVAHTNNWQHLTATLSVPTFTKAVKYIEFLFLVETVTPQNTPIRFACCQAELGEHFTELERTDYQTELKLCQPFLVKLSESSNAFIGGVSNNVPANTFPLRLYCYPFPVTMYRVPDVTAVTGHNSGTSPQIFIQTLDYVIQLAAGFSAGAHNYISELTADAEIY